MKTTTQIALFRGKKIRKTIYNNEWWFSVVDIIEALTDSMNPNDYWYKMKIRVKSEDGIELSTICRQLKLESSDGKKYETDCANTEAIFRIIQSIPSPKAAFGITPSQYKKHKNLKRENLCDHMDDLELIFTMLGERSTTEIHRNENSRGFPKLKSDAKAGGDIAGIARNKLEKRLGRSVVSQKNYLKSPENKKLIRK